MKLLRVQVPDFRVLKNVDISFEKDFVPNIFPLGSQNGGGKSTLLQLIFILLNCSADSSKHEFIQNLLYGFKIDDNSHKRVLAIFDIWDGEKTVNLEFCIYNNNYIQQMLAFSQEPSYPNIIDDSDDDLIFSAPNKLKEVSQKIEELESQISQLNPLLDRLESINNIENPEERELQLKNIGRSLRGLNIFNFTGKRDFKERIIVEDMKTVVIKQLNLRQSNLEELSIKREQLEINTPIILDFLRSDRTAYICNYFNSGDTNKDTALLCRVNNLNLDQTEDFLTKISKTTFLAAPTTQVFLFLTQKQIKQLFQQRNNYQYEIQITKSKLTGFFPYDFFAVNLLIDIFKNARDKDFKKAIETGEYGNNYQQLVNDLNQTLLNKKININSDLSGLNFKLDVEDEDIELFPEDLSHGELKRLSIYAWIKYNIREDSIVLIDEIENGLHPDWQYQIIKDIAEWAPQNQYIIATHSYELCQAVTPAHVKELEPRLIKEESES